MEKYEQRGVSAGKEGVVAATKKLSLGLFPHTFCKILEDMAGHPDYCSLVHADGAGTKTSLAYAYWRETGDISVWKGVAQDALVMNLDDALCSGFGLRGETFYYSQSIDRNKRLVPNEVLEAIINGTQELFDMLAGYGIDIRYAGGETADVGDLVRTITLNATLVARMNRSQVQQINLEPGLAIVGLASFGQATYETEYNSGMGSNGLTSARHDMFKKYVGSKYPETFDVELPADITYCGNYRLEDLAEYAPGKTMPMGKFVLSPTRTFAPVLMELTKRLDEQGETLSGIIHCSGGGTTKVKKYIPDNVTVIKDSLFKTPKLFSLIQDASKTDWKEMYKVFNMGCRMEIYCKPELVQTVIGAAAKFNVEAKQIGICGASQGKPELRVVTRYGTFEY